MQGKKAAAVLLLGGTLGLVAWQRRRHLLARALRLPPPRYAVGVEQGLITAMPDGVTLVADHYYPQAVGEFPTILRRTPYGRNTSLSSSGLFAAFCARLFAERGYHVVMQDVRGRGESEGEFAPFENESADGRATLDWVQRQPWFNGALGLWGESYNGYTQWAVTPDAPAYLKALVPSISSALGYSYAYAPDGIFYLYGLLHWTTMLERSKQMGRWLLATLRGESRSLGAQMAEAFDHLPLEETDEVALGEPVPYYRNWLAHPDANDPYWRAMDYRATLPELTAPVHLVGGWYDIFIDEMLRDYSTLKAAGRNPYLTIGPWTHGLSPTFESVREAIPWFATHLKGAPATLRPHAVRYYVMGANEWREADSWPPSANPILYFLHSSRQLATEAPENNSSPDVYRYNPADPTPSLGGPLLNPPNGALDNRSIEVRPDVLSYTAAPLTEDVEVIGAVSAELYVRSNLGDTDFFVRLCDVYPDGRSVNICDGLTRIRPGDGEAQPDGSLRIVVDMSHTAMRFPAGHSIRVQVTSGAHPRYNRNLGTGEPVAAATRMQQARQAVYHDQAHPSAVMLPVYRSYTELAAQDARTKPVAQCHGLYSMLLSNFCLQPRPTGWG